MIFNIKVKLFNQKYEKDVINAFKHLFHSVEKIDLTKTGILKLMVSDMKDKPDFLTLDFAISKMNITINKYAADKYIYLSIKNGNSWLKYNNGLYKPAKKVLNNIILNKDLETAIENLIKIKEELNITTSYIKLKTTTVRYGNMWFTGTKLTLHYMKKII